MEVKEKDMQLHFTSKGTYTKLPRNEAPYYYFIIVIIWLNVLVHYYR